MCAGKGINGSEFSSWAQIGETCIKATEKRRNKTKRSK
jgi:hypothetical protein